LPGGIPVEIIVLAKQFRYSAWETWEHLCSPEEIDAVEDSARASALNRFSFSQLIPIDYLEGARYVFEVACGPANHPRDGDIRVYGARINGFQVGASEELGGHPSEPEKAA
jgi:hypothetical protein